MHKYTYITFLVTSNEFNIIALTETWLNVIDTVNPAAIYGYRCPPNNSKLIM